MSQSTDRTILKTANAVDLSPTSLTLTAAYGGWISDIFDCSKFDVLKVYLEFSGGLDATTVELKSQVEDRLGVDFFTEFQVQPGVAPQAVTLDEIQVTVADLAAESSRICIHFSCKTFRRVRFQAKRTGGTAGALTLEVTGG